MVGASHHEYAIVRFEAIYFIEEVASHIIGDNGVQVFEDKVAGGIASCLTEDLADRSLWAHELCNY